MLWIFNLSSSQISSSFDRNGEKNAEYFTHRLLLYQNVHPTEHKPERVLKLFATLHISKILKLLFIWFHVPNIRF